jgi:hypothetical protein
MFVLSNGELHFYDCKLDKTFFIRMKGSKSALSVSRTAVPFEVSITSVLPSWESLTRNGQSGLLQLTNATLVYPGGDEEEEQTGTPGLQSGTSEPSPTVDETTANTGSASSRSKGRKKEPAAKWPAPAARKKKGVSAYSKLYYSLNYSLITCQPRRLLYITRRANRKSTNSIQVLSSRQRNPLPRKGGKVANPAGVRRLKHKRSLRTTRTGTTAVRRKNLWHRPRQRWPREPGPQRVELVWSSGTAAKTILRLRQLQLPHSLPPQHPKGLARSSQPFRLSPLPRKLNPALPRHWRSNQVIGSCERPAPSAPFTSFYTLMALHCHSPIPSKIASLFWIDSLPQSHLLFQIIQSPVATGSPHLNESKLLMFPTRNLPNGPSKKATVSI